MKAREKYQQKIERQELYIRKMQRILGWLSVSRLISFLASFVIIYFWAIFNHQAWLAGFFITIALFIFLIKRYIYLKRKTQHAKHLADINHNEVMIMDGNPSRWADGKEYINSIGYSEDLDIFGHKSLFHLVNRTGTPYGRNRLARVLDSPFLNSNVISRHQEAIRELSPEIHLRQELHAFALEAREEAGEPNDNGFETIRTCLKGIPSGWRWFGPLIIAGSVLIYIFTGFYSFIILSVLVNLFLAGLYSRKIQKAHKAVSGNRDQLSAYASMFRTISEKSFTSEIMKGIHEQSGEAYLGFKKLSNISEMFDRRMNLLVYFFLNSLYLYDFFTINTLKKWTEKYGNKMASWFEMLGHIEFINSFATFNFNHPDFNFPKPQEENNCIISKHMGHPLIPKNQRIHNDIDLGCQDRIYLITGSNMSGKSTYLRTVGINMILARCGSPVCANEFNFKPMEILTSIHLSDSLRENKSLFFAELERLSLIINKISQGYDALVLIDEMLKGTNSDDKTSGSMALIQQLIESNCLAIIATHDIQLGILEKQNPGIVCNYCFESTIEKGNLTFDYKIKPGISINKNASFLMKKMGIIK